jgi:nucleoside-diphosphate-sugar epimerase
LADQETVLITGATGLLGRNITNHFLSKNFKVIGAKRSTSITFNHPDLSWIELDKLLEFDPKDFKIDFVIHCAGLVSYNASDKDELFKVNKDITESIAKWARSARVKKFVYISSIATLGKNSDSQIINENTPWDDSDFTTNYALSKRAGEKAVQENGAKGVNYIILNPSIILGPAELSQSSAKLFQYVLDQKPFFTKGFINYIDVRDISNVIFKLLESNIVKEQFVINSGYTTYKSFFKQLAEKLNCKAPFIAVPNFSLILGAHLENLWSKFKNKEPLLSSETARIAGNKYIYDSIKIKNELDIEFHTLEESINYSIAEMKKAGYIKL